MFYLLVGILLALYYLFALPKTLKGTMRTVVLVGMSALFLVLGVLGLLKAIQSPPEIFIGVGMSIFGIFVLRDVLRLPTRRVKSMDK